MDRQEAGEYLLRTEMCESSYIVTTETLLLKYLEYMKTAAAMGVCQSVQTRCMEAIAYTLRELLRDPLSDARFRRHFNDYFEHHLMRDVRQEGVDVLNEILIWEK